MKQAQVDADELIAAYRLEQQDAFDKKANADGKSIKCWAVTWHPSQVNNLYNIQHILSIICPSL